MPLVSVIIPAFNPGSFLQRSVGSVLTQTAGDLECIVVDDGSTEDLASIEILGSPRVRFHRQENRGVSAARNVGASLSNGKYLAFLDQDDEWMPRKLEYQLESLQQRPSASFSHTPFIWMLPTGERPSQAEPCSYRNSLAARSYACISSLVVDRAKHDAVGGHDPRLAQQQDWDFILKLLQVFGDPTCESQHLVRYFVHENNASVDYWTAELEARSIYDRAKLQATRDGDEATLSAIRRGVHRTRSVHGFQAVDQLRASVRNGDWRLALLHLKRGLALDPSAVAQSAWSFALHRATGAKAHGNSPVESPSPVGS